jgi:RNA 2',3'-cyclic 3'-phosphodiesterase
VREKKDIRLYFALWPQETVRQRLHAAAATIGVDSQGRRVPRANLHLTLHFIGNVYLSQMECLQRAARLVRARAFDLTIDRQGYFNKPRVAWLGCSNPPAALDDLHRQLGGHLQSCDYRPEARPYQPHVTVARKIGPIAGEPGFAPVDWRVTEFALIEVRAIDNGVQYRAVETYPLN